MASKSKRSVCLSSVLNKLRVFIKGRYSAVVIRLKARKRGKLFAIYSGFVKPLKSKIQPLFKAPKPQISKLSNAFFINATVKQGYRIHLHSQQAMNTVPSAFYQLFILILILCFDRFLIIAHFDTKRQILIKLFNFKY